MIIFSLKLQTERKFSTQSWLLPFNLLADNEDFFINLATGQIFMRSQANFGPQYSGYQLKNMNNINMTACSFIAHSHIQQKTLLFCLHRLLAKKTTKSVRTALVCYSSEEKQWVLCTWLSQFIRIRIISSLAQKLQHMQAMLMSLAPGNNQERRPKGCVVCVFQPAAIWKHYTSTASTFL